MTNRLKCASLVFVFVLAALIVPSAAAAQPVLSVSPTSLSLQASVGANVPNKTIEVKNAGTRALKWSVVQPTANWLALSPTSGTNSGTLVLTFKTSSLPVGTHQTSFRVQSTTGSFMTVNVQVSMVAAPAVAKLGVSCPANMTVASPTGSPIPVPYSITTAGGVAPVTVSGTPASGSLFPVGTTSVLVTARSSDGQTASCGFSVTVTAVTTSTTSYGPQSTIVCPTDAIDIFPGISIQTLVNVYPGTTTFCLRAGQHSLVSAITPKTGNIFVGEYGAILDGTGWTTTDGNQGAFRAHNQDIDDVTIRNLVIRNMPQRGIHAYYWMSDRWTIEYNEIAGNLYGLQAPNASVVRHNYIHHNVGNSASSVPAERGGGYSVWRATNVTFEHNEFAYNGREQKVLGTTNVTFRNNFVHHNVLDGIWYDSENTGALIEGNRVEDNGREGIFYEVSARAVIRNNTIRRNATSGIFISTSKDVEIYNNTLEDNYRGIQYFLNCAAVGGGTLTYDLSNNNTHDNRVKVGTQSGALGNAFSYISSCTSTQVAPYLNGSKNLKFQNNSYTVPSLVGRYWVWGLGAFKYWYEWQALLQDATGTMSQ